MTSGPSATSPSGTMSVRRLTDGIGPDVVCLHGFSQTGAMFTELANLLEYPAIAPDLPGHGGTTTTPVDLPTTLAVLAELLGDGPAHPVVGYSQGGRLAIHLALARPDLIERLVVISAGPGLDRSARPHRRAADESLADRITRIGLAAFLDEWCSHPLVGTTHVDPSQAHRDRLRREENSPEGLAGALRGLGQGVVPAAELEGLAVPTLWISGAHDAAYTTIAAEAAARSSGRHVAIDAAGHNVVLEAPQALARAINGFLRDPSRA